MNNVMTVKLKLLGFCDIGGNDGGDVCGRRWNKMFKSKIFPEFYGVIFSLHSTQPLRQG